MTTGAEPPVDRLRQSLAAAARRLQRYLAFLGCRRDEVDDLAQEALLAGLARWPDGSAPLPWLFRTARNLFRRHLRDRGRAVELLDEALFAGEAVEVWRAAGGDGAADRARDALRECLDGVPARSRQVLEWRYGDGLDRTAIARRAGLGAEGVKSMLARLRASLADCVQRKLQREERDDA